MRSLVQVVCVAALALGAGLFAFGGYLDPQPGLRSPDDVARFVGRFSDRDDRMMASIARGFGIGFMALGGLGLVVPWVNTLVAGAGRRGGNAPLDQAAPAAEKVA